jgi:hypothetical protein
MGGAVRSSSHLLLSLIRQEQFVVKKKIVLPLAAMLIAGPAFASSVTVTPALSFNGSSGNVSSQPITITITGSQPLTIRSVSFSNNAFSIQSIPVPVTLPAGRSYTGQITAQPRSTAQAGKLTIGTDAGTFVVSLTETAIATQPATTAHSVNLSGKATATTPVPVDSYQVNRAVSGSTQYSVVGTTTSSSTAFTDTSVQSGQTYVYQVRSIDQSGNTSNPSNSVTLAIP